MITKRVVASSVVTQVMASSFSTVGTSIVATIGNPVTVFLTNLTNRLWLGGSSAVTTANGYVVSSASSTNLFFRAGEELWCITSAAVNTTATFAFFNQPV